MAIRAFCLLYAGLTILVMDPSRWSENYLYGIFAIFHIALSLTLSFKARRDSPAQWLALTFILISFAASLAYLGDWETIRRLGISVDLDLAHMAVAGGAFIHFGQAFGVSPEVLRTRASHRQRLLDRVPIVLGMAFGGIYFGIQSMPYVGTSGFEMVVFGWMVLAFIIGARHLFLNYRSADRRSRLRIKWAVLASAIWMIVFGVYFSFGFPWWIGLGPYSWTSSGGLLEAVCMVGATVGSGCLVYGMLTHGTIDPSFAIHKTTVYGALGILFLFLFAGVGNFVQDAAQQFSGLSGSFGSIVTGGMVAVVVLPLKGRFSKVADRYLPKVERNADERA